MIENYFFEKNKKYKVIEPFSWEDSFFLPNEEVKFIGRQFIPYDGAWSYAFKNKKKEFKYFVIWDKEELKSYTKFFIKECKDKKSLLKKLKSYTKFFIKE